MTARHEAQTSFACFGATCAVLVLDERPVRAETAVATARSRLLALHARFTRFASSSELSRLNADPAAEVPASAEMRAFVRAAADAARITGGLVDATLLGEIEDAGYRADLRTSLPLPLALRLAPPRAAASPLPTGAWERVRVDDERGTVSRPPGLHFDSGGLAKGLFADLIAAQLSRHAAFAVDCAGDLRLGGTGDVARRVDVAGPFDGSTLHAFELSHGGVATSGIGRRSWLDARGRPAHHLLDPATGRPAFTGLVQVTALAPTALEAEMRSKAALLSGPDGAARRLPGGGVLVFDDGTHRVLDGHTAPPTDREAASSPWLAASAA